MTLESLEYYTSDIVDPSLNGDLDQEDSKEIGFIVYRQQSILKTIGTPECQVNIKLFFRDVVDELTKEGKVDYARECLRTLIETYNLTYLETILDNTRIDIDYTDKIFELLIFLEGFRLVEVMAHFVPYVSLEVIRSKDKLKEFLKLNYKEFVQNLEDHRSIIPDLFFEQFFYCAKEDGIKTVVMLLQKNALAVHSLQITKGNTNDHN